MCWCNKILHGEYIMFHNTRVSVCPSDWAHWMCEHSESSKVPRQKFIYERKKDEEDNETSLSTSFFRHVASPTKKNSWSSLICCCTVYWFFDVWIKVTFILLISFANCCGLFFVVRTFRHIASSWNTHKIAPIAMMRRHSCTQTSS